MPRSYSPKQGKNVRRIDSPGRRGYVRIKEFPFVTGDPAEQEFLDGHPLLEAEDVDGPEPAATENARPPKPEASAATAESAEKPLDEMNKNELMEAAERRGVDVKKSMTKDAILSLVKVHDSADDGEPEEHALAEDEEANTEEVNA